jgi:hypothetical protein
MGLLRGCGHCGVDSKNSSLGIARISKLKRGGPDQQHGSARWSRACQLAAQSSRGEVLSAHAARGKMGKIDPPRGRATDLYALTARAVCKR